MYTYTHYRVDAFNKQGAVYISNFLFRDVTEAEQRAQGLLGLKRGDSDINKVTVTKIVVTENNVMEFK